MPTEKDVIRSPDNCRIINQVDFETLQQKKSGQNTLAGGQSDAAENYLSPTLLDNPAMDSKVMQREIFGPILPIIGFMTKAGILIRYAPYQNKSKIFKLFLKWLS